MFKLFDHVIDKFIMNFKSNLTIFVRFIKRPVVYVLEHIFKQRLRACCSLFTLINKICRSKDDDSNAKFFRILKSEKKTREKDLDFLKQFNCCNIDDERGIDGMKIQVKLFNHDKRLSM